MLVYTELLSIQYLRPALTLIPREYPSGTGLGTAGQIREACDWRMARRATD